MESFKPIHLTTFEEMKTKKINWCERTNRAVELERLHQSFALTEEQRVLLRASFPFAVVLEGATTEHDFVERWCWQSFGPPTRLQCHDDSSEYPGCPLVLATEEIMVSSYFDKEGKKQEHTYKTYQEVEAHAHDGVWTTKYLGKSGYDYGYNEYYFQNEQDYKKFVEAIPMFGLGENYE